MKMLCIVLLYTSLIFAQQTTAPATDAEAQSVEKKEEFSMRSYFMGFLKRGPNWTAERTPEIEEIGKGHMAHIGKMAAAGDLIIAGPFVQGEDATKGALAGIFIFDVPTKEAAIALMKDDPAVKAGRLTIEVLEWYGPAGLTYTGHKPSMKDE